MDGLMREREHQKDPGDGEELLSFPIQHSYNLHVTFGRARCVEFLQLLSLWCFGSSPRSY